MMNWNKSEIEWIFFDLGSTLIDETEVYAQRFRETVRGSDVSVSEFQKTAVRFWAQGLDGYPQAAAYYGLSKAPWRSGLKNFSPTFA